MEEPTAEIEFVSATAGYCDRPVLRSVDLKIASGEFVLIGGPNGGGKTTLLKCIAGLIPLMSGTRRVRAARFGYVPQQADSETSLPITALELVELGASARLSLWQTLLRRERAFAMKCLADCHADSFAQKGFGDISGGQRQRVLVARALAIEPEVLLLDEPTAGIDRETRQRITSLLQRLNEERGTTVVMVSHEPASFEHLFSHSYWVAEGEVLPRPK
jgi:ABC-type Mn2+/Zn2+ transport system ATPase subunit